MKQTCKHIVLAGLMATLGLAAVAQPTAPASPPTGPAAAQHQPQAQAREHGRHFDPARMQERMERRMARRMADFKEKLAITPAQEGAWNAFVGAMKPQMMQRPDRAEFARMTTPERIDRMKAMRAARMAQADKRGDATKAFYSALTPDQKKVFDETTARRMGKRRGHGGVRHHGPYRM